MSNHGLKVSIGGVEVRDADTDEIVVSTEFSQYKVHEQGTFSVTVPALSLAGTTTIPHDLGYEPSFLVFLEEVAGDGKKRMVAYRQTNALNAKVDTEDLIVTVDYPLGGSFPSSKVHNGYYFIFKDEI